MRQITNNAVNAFIAKQNFGCGNTTVTNNGDKTEMYLFGNLIAYEINQNVYISSQGYETSTTRERLNGLVQALECGRVYIKGGSMWYETSGKTITDSLFDCMFTQIR